MSCVFPVVKVDVPVPTFNAWPLVRPLPVLMLEAVPVVVALFTDVVPVKVEPPSFDTLSRMSLLQAPGVLTPVKRLAPVAGLKPAGMQPLASFEWTLM